MKQKEIILFFLFLFSTSLFGRSAKENTGSFIETRGYLLEGSSTYEQNSGRTTGIAYQLLLGYRPGSFLKLGVLGMYDSFSVRVSGTEVGKANNIGYGGFVRLFFFPFIFVEGGGGILQTNFEPEVTKQILIADASYYFTGMGVEMYLASWVSFVATAHVRQTIYPKNEFTNTTSFNVGGGLSFYID